MRRDSPSSIFTSVIFEAPKSSNMSVSMFLRIGKEFFEKHRAMKGSFNFSRTSVSQKMNSDFSTCYFLFFAKSLFSSIRDNDDAEQRITMNKWKNQPKDFFISNEI